MKSIRCFFISITLCFYSLVVYGQSNIVILNSLGEHVANKKVTISQGQLVLERFSNFKGELKLEPMVFDTIQPLKITPYGFLPKLIKLNKGSITITFETDVYTLDEVLLFDKRTKIVKFRNFSHEDNRKKGFTFSSGKVDVQINNFVEYITAVPELGNDGSFDLIKSIAIEVENTAHRDTSLVTLRLNIYNKKKELVFSTDNILQLKEIKKDLIFELEMSNIQATSIGFIGVSSVMTENTAQFPSAYKPLFLSQMEFTEAKTYAKFIDKLSSLSPEWQLISRFNEELNPLLSDLFHGNPDIDMKNYNLKIEVMCVKK